MLMFVFLVARSTIRRGRAARAPRGSQWRLRACYSWGVALPFVTRRTGAAPALPRSRARAPNLCLWQPLQLTWMHLDANAIGSHYPQNIG